MNIKKYWMMLAIVLVSLCTISCGGNDDEEDVLPNNENSSEVSTSSTATTSIKKSKLQGGYTPNIGCDFYEGFNNKYTLSLWGGQICIYHMVRGIEGYWKEASSFKEAGIISTGKCNNIQDVTSKDIPEGSGGRSNYNVSNVQPNYGYACYFTTDDAIVKYMRLYIKDYSLDSQGTLESITIQYQLY